MQFFLLAFRNVFRNRRRTAMTLFIVGSGVAGLLLVGGFFLFMFQGLRETTIRSGLGHLQIYNAERLRTHESHVLEHGIDDWRALAAAVSGTPHVKGVSARIDFSGMISNGLKSSVFMGSAADPKAEASMGFTPRLQAGRNLAEHDGIAEALIGTGVARSMGVSVGDELTIMAVTADGALNGLDVRVAGIVHTGVKELDDRYLRIPLTAAQMLLQSERVSNLVVGLDRTENTDLLAGMLAARFAGGEPALAIRRWVDLATFYRQVRMLFTGIFVFVGAIVFLLVVAASANTLMMAMFERTREIGTMLAMGTPRSWIVGLFVLEATLLGVLGGLAGLAAGTGLGMALNRSGVQLPPPPGQSVSMPFQVLHDPGLMLGAALLVTLTLAAASFIPALRASRMRIAEALTHV